MHANLENTFLLWTVDSISFTFIKRLCEICNIFEHVKEQTRPKQMKANADVSWGQY